ncbi:MAG: translational GTPase TypA [Christensenellales bacterium]|jgi:GTP-binding protein
MIRNDLRNIAIIAHVDHGKTTLVDALLRQSGVFRDNQAVAERVMDSGDLERERGITILAKNTAIHWKGTKINIVDTPGHADFGGEVERVLQMVNGVLLLVDAYEGPMPQTRFVLTKALALGLKVIIVVNKVDRPDARCADVLEETQLLLMELGATDEQLDSPVMYISARSGVGGHSPDDMEPNLHCLLDEILSHIPAPQGNENASLQMLISTVDYNDYLGRIGIGRVNRGNIAVGNSLLMVNHHSGKVSAPNRITALYQFDGLDRVPVDHAGAGDIVAVSGIPNLEIGDTLCPPDRVEALPFVKISEPTVVMTFSVNDSPLSGTEGKYVTSRHLSDRLFRETETDVSLRVETTERADAFRVFGRGELHLSILIETMRRQGYEFAVSKPDVILREDDEGRTTEPLEDLVIDVPEEHVGSVMEKLSRRKGELKSIVNKDGRTRLEFVIPSRGLFGYHSEILTDTRGEGIMTSVFHGYGLYRGILHSRTTGSLVATQDGIATPYALFGLQDRGIFFIEPGTRVYCGMVVGSGTRTEDIDINVCKKKNLTNTRAAAKDDNVILAPARVPTLEQALEYIGDDELVEVTPQSIRIRKRVLNAVERMRANRRAMGQ